jgi:hypothetical protein
MGIEAGFASAPYAKLPGGATISGPLGFWVEHEAWVNFPVAGSIEYATTQLLTCAAYRYLPEG